MHEELMIWFAQAIAHSLWEGVVIGALAWGVVRVLRKGFSLGEVQACSAMERMRMNALKLVR